MAQYVISLLGSPTAQTILGDKAFGLNSFSATVGVAHIPEARAVFWNPGPAKLPLLGLNSVAYAVNDSGHIVGAWGNNALPESNEIDPVTGPAGQSFLYSNGEMHDLGSVFGTQVSVATDINNDWVDRRLGWGDPLAGQTLDLNDHIPSDSGWLLHWASAINDNRQIVGTGTFNGLYRAYLLTPLIRLDDDLAGLITQILLKVATPSSPGLVITEGGKKIPIYPWGGPVDPLGP
jgi:hypothetical protein